MTKNTHFYTSSFIALTMKALLIFIEAETTDLKIFYELLATVQTHILTGKKSKKIS